MFQQNDKYQVTSDDNKVFTYTIQAVASAFVEVYSSGLEGIYRVSHRTFRDFLRVVGAHKVEDKSPLYRIYYINEGYYSCTEHEFINMAIKVGKNNGKEFRVELGDMICCAWDPITGLRFFADYQQWAQDQVEALNRVEGSLE